MPGRFPWSNRLLCRLVVASTAALITQAAARGDPARRAPDYAPLALSTNDRILVLAPHPDDEAIACGGVLQRAAAAGIAARVVFFTYGDNNQWSFLLYRKHAVLAPSAVRQMGLLRHDEAIQADSDLGIGPQSLTFLGYPDFGTFHIWTEHWDSAPPLESMLTRVTRVPYPNALHPGSLYKGEEILRDLTALLRSFRPTRIFVSHPADFNPDHRALYLFTLVALWDLEKEMKPLVHPYLVHFPRWPEPRGAHPELGIDPPDFLAHQTAWHALELTPREQETKRKAIELHRTQFGYAGKYLSSFVRTREIFGDLPIVSCAPGDSTNEMALVQGANRDEAGPDDLLNEEERALFVGVECRKVQLDPRRVTVSIDLSRPLGDAVAAHVTVFGYRHDVPFGKMPKVHVRIGHVAHLINDRGAVLRNSGVEVSRSAREIRVSVPFATLNAPERLLLSARTQLGEVPLDWASWRVIELAGTSTIHQPTSGGL